MAEYVIANKSDMTSVANAIRTKGNTTSALSFPDGMIGAIQAIEGGGATPTLQAKTVAPDTSAKTVTPDSGYDGLSQVTVSAIQTETKSVTPSTSAQTVTPTSGKYLSKVTVGAISTETKSVTPTTSSQNVTPSSGKYLSKVTVGAIGTETRSIIANGTYTPSSGKYFSSVTVNVPSNSTTPSLQTKTVAPSESEQTVTADSGYDGLSSVTVDAISSTYVGSEVPTQAATTITPSSSAQTAIAANTYVTGAVTVAKVPTETKSVTANGTYTPTSGKFFSSVTVNVPTDSSGSVETSSVTITNSSLVTVAIYFNYNGSSNSVALGKNGSNTFPITTGEYFVIVGESASLSVAATGANVILNPVAKRTFILSPVSSTATITISTYSSSGSVTA